MKAQQQNLENHKHQCGDQSQGPITRYQKKAEECIPTTEFLLQDAVCLHQDLFLLRQESSTAIVATDFCQLR